MVTAGLGERGRKGTSAHVSRGLGSSLALRHFCHIPLAKANQPCFKGWATDLERPRRWALGGVEKGGHFYSQPRALLNICLEYKNQNFKSESFGDG